MPNKFKVFYTPTAKSDFANIIDYIADDNLDAAITFADKIEHTVASLSEFPFMGAVPNVAKLRLQGYKLLIIDNYIAFYTPDKTTETVSIIRILSASRNYRDLMD
jgi:toxin ParE1/3/4